MLQNHSILFETSDIIRVLQPLHHSPTEFQVDDLCLDPVGLENVAQELLAQLFEAKDSKNFLELVVFDLFLDREEPAEIFQIANFSFHPSHEMAELGPFSFHIFLLQNFFHRFFLCYNMFADCHH